MYKIITQVTSIFKSNDIITFDILLILMIKDFLACLGFFTIIPIPHKNFHIDSLSQILPWISAVGLLIGILLEFSHLIISYYFPPLLTAVCVLIIWVTISGGLHLDGLADCFDSFMCSASSEKRKQILKDPHLGTFGVLGVCITILFKFSLIYSQTSSEVVISNTHGNCYIGLLLAPLIARWSILWLIVFFPVGGDGLGQHFSKGLNLRSFSMASIIPLILSGIFGIKAVIGLLLSIIIIWILGKISMQKIGEIRGDVMGLGIEINEIINLFIYVF